MVSVLGKEKNDNTWIEWRYLDDEDLHIVENHYSGEFTFCATHEEARKAFERFMEKEHVKQTSK